MVGNEPQLALRTSSFPLHLPNSPQPSTLYTSKALSLNHLPLSW